MFQLFEMKVEKRMLLPNAHPNQKVWDMWICVCISTWTVVYHMWNFTLTLWKKVNWVWNLPVTSSWTWG